MYKNRLLRKEDIEKFSKTLLLHQKAVNATNMTILEMAVLEHNMLACSLLYNNITFLQLGTLLNVSSREAEKVCSKMIGENRLSGMIDQVDGILYFGQYNDVTKEQQSLIKFDQEIGLICGEMNDVVFEIDEENKK